MDLKERTGGSAGGTSGLAVVWNATTSQQLWIGLALLLLVVLSALGVIYNAYQGRQLFGELETLKKESIALEEEWGRLLLEQSTWAAHSRIERMARTQLKMVVPDQSNMIVVGQ